uniref:Uncharacterized protein n=1 Tax=Ascaris lumbricoides TaxID=6252 RepID=A0A0M3HXR8_ASCLU
MERKSSGSQRGSMDQILGQPKVSDPSGFEVDLLFTSNNDIILLPHRDSSPNIVLSRGMDELQVSSSKNRRQSLGAGVFDISARGSNSSSDIRKRRRESNKETLMMRRDSGIQEFDARTSAPVYAVSFCYS